MLYRSNIGIINALKNGPITLTSLFCQLSLLLASAWGFIFWGAEFTFFTATGLVLAATALWLCLYGGKKKANTKTDIKWFFFVSLAVIGNAGCSIIQRTQQ